VLGSSLRRQGPIRRSIPFWYKRQRLLSSNRPVVMGPCLRKDDVKISSGRKMLILHIYLVLRFALRLTWQAI